MLSASLNMKRSFRLETHNNNNKKPLLGTISEEPKLT